MYLQKKYGEGKFSRCLFCGNNATTKNKEGIFVCSRHSNAVMSQVKCICGNELELKSGKYGNYFYCIRCGNINMKKALEMNNAEDVSKKEQPKKTELFIRSDDPRFF